MKAIKHANFNVEGDHALMVPVEYEWVPPVSVKSKRFDHIDTTCPTVKVGILLHMCDKPNYDAYVRRTSEEATKSTDIVASIKIVRQEQVVTPITVDSIIHSPSINKKNSSI